uniref:Uncharacterized protein n=1 Tax=Panagrellus redivivus TaxID=6233 RepID=A0A7E5A106_PANRE
MWYRLARNNLHKMLFGSCLVPNLKLPVDGKYVTTASVPSVLTQVIDNSSTTDSWRILWPRPSPGTL